MHVCVFRERERVKYKKININKLVFKINLYTFPLIQDNFQLITVEKENNTKRKNIREQHTSLKKN